MNIDFVISLPRRYASKVYFPARFWPRDPMLPPMGFAVLSYIYRSVTSIG